MHNNKKKKEEEKHYCGIFSLFLFPDYFQIHFSDCCPPCPILTEEENK